MSLVTLASPAPLVSAGSHNLTRMEQRDTARDVLVH
jgi:hypothetical protein